MARPLTADRRAGFVKGAFLVGYFALLGLQALWHGFWYPAPSVILVLALAPLAAPLPWLLRGAAPRAPLVVAYLSLGYFIHGVTEALVSPERRAPALAEVALSLGLCALVAPAQRAWGAATRRSS